MMLRNRDLNVQKNVDAANAQQQKQKGGGAHQVVINKVAGGGGGAVAAKPQGTHHHAKRQAAHLVRGGRSNGESSGSGGSSANSQETAEPRAKRTCSQTDKERILQTLNLNNNNNVLLPAHNHNNNAPAAVPVSAFSRSLMIDSAKKETNNNNNNKADGARNAVYAMPDQRGGKRVSVGGAAAAPHAARRRASAVLSLRDSNAGAGGSSSSSSQHSSSSQQSSQSSVASLIKENQENNEQNMEQEQDGVEELFDFDKEVERDMSAVSEYARDIFQYYKHRERFFRVSDYIRAAKHPEIVAKARAKLIDWMVELQETFELNHETLYLGVKLVDMFLDRTNTTVRESQLQLIASAGLFIASKFDERAPPLVDDFIYLSDDNFTHDQMLEMERVLLKTVGFDLGSPLSYRFLRRYARVCKMDMGTLTLARYVLETSLMYMGFCLVSESKIAAACLLLALRMKGIGDWGPILTQYTGHARAEIEQLMGRLNRMITERKLQHPELKTIHNKYSHEIFFEVAKIKPLALRDA